MKYLPYYSGFMFGFAVASLAWIFIMTRPVDTVLSYSKSFCERQGFNSFTLDEHANVFCINVIKNDGI